MAGRTKHQELLCHQLSSQLQSQVPVHPVMLMQTIKQCIFTNLAVKCSESSPASAAIVETCRESTYRTCRRNLAMRTNVKALLCNGSDKCHCTAAGASSRS